eukprot:TRINITY_DN25684_c0_g1_i1.p1 TRINITY_DN25684_c0_g1~~TRINITY_DN25684_c0_g1_i1.p1  ORF type:complete len:420 (-),score=8.81 TRINITY_DN25684_c0_g1_i1:208-1422(-)
MATTLRRHASALQSPKLHETHPSETEGRASIQSLQGFKRIEGFLRCAMGVVATVRFRAVCASVKNAVDKAWTRSGAALIPLSSNRARHALARDIGILEETLDELPVQVIRTLCAISIGAKRSGDDTEGGSPLKKKRSGREALIVRWLLEGCCSFQQLEGLSEACFLSANLEHLFSTSLPCTLGCTTWPAALVVINTVSQCPDLGSGSAVLELGAGSGRLGLALASRASTVVLTDGDTRCLKLLQANAALNNGEGNSNVKVCGPLLFGETSLSGHEHLVKSFDLIVASDVLYASQAAQGECPVKRFWRTADAFLSDRPHYSLSQGASKSCTHGNRTSGILLGFMERNVVGAPTMRELITEASSYSYEVCLLGSQSVSDPANGSTDVSSPVRCNVLLFTRHQALEC